jgi:hypothetical protein
MVQLARPGCYYDWYQVSTNSSTSSQLGLSIKLSYACATFIATAATLGTNFVSSPSIVIGIYAAVLITQGEYTSFSTECARF